MQMNKKITQLESENFDLMKKNKSLEQIINRFGDQPTLLEIPKPDEEIKLSLQTRKE